MREIPLQFDDNALEKKRAGKGVSPPPGSNHMEPDKEVHDMADFGHYSDSTDTIKCGNNVSERPDLTAAVILAFRDGLGVEDIGVLGIAPTAYARAVLKRLHAMGMTEKLFRQPKAKTPNNKWNPIGGLAAALVDDAARKIAATKEGGET